MGSGVGRLWGGGDGGGAGGGAGGGGGSHHIVSVITVKLCLLFNPTGCQDRAGGVHQPPANGAQVVSAALPGALPQGVACHSHPHPHPHPTVSLLSTITEVFGP